MGRSRRKYKKSRTKVRVGLPKKNPNIFKPSFILPPKLRSLLQQRYEDDPKWDDKASVIHNYKTFGVVSNPNLLGVRSRTNHIIESDSLQVPPPPPDQTDVALDDMDSGSELEEDDLKTVLGKKRKDGKSAPPQPLTAMQRLHISRLIEKYGDDYQRMFMDTKLNAMQHSVATLEKLCKRITYDKNDERPPLNYEKAKAKSLKDP